jgi:hypothetical protein
MRPFAFALMMSLAALSAASAQPAIPDSENGRYSFNPMADGVLPARYPHRSGLAMQPERCRLDLQGGPRRALIARVRDRPPAGRERDPEEGTARPWAAATRCTNCAIRQAQRTRAQAAERCRGRQGDVFPREGLAPAGRDGERGAEGCREKKLRGCYFG